MIEITANTRARNAITFAHEERAQAFARVLSWMFGRS